MGFRVWASELRGVVDVGCKRGIRGSESLFWVADPAQYVVKALAGEELI